MQRLHHALVYRAGDVLRAMIQGKAHQRARYLGRPPGRALAHQRGQIHHALRAHRSRARQRLKLCKVAVRRAGAGIDQVFNRPVGRGRAALHRAAHIIARFVQIEIVK